MRALVALALALCALPMTASAQTAGLQVTPVVIQMPADRGITSFRVHNGRDRETAFEVEAFVWTQENGESVLTPTGDLVIAPSTFIAPANGDQIIRLALPANLRSGAGERSYRVLLREIPNINTPRTGFRLVVEMSMPVFVTPRGARGQLMVRQTRDANGMPAVVLQNTGAARLQLSETPGAENISNLPRYLLAGQQAVRPVSAPAIRLMTASAGDIEARLETFDLAHAPVLAASR